MVIGEGRGYWQQEAKYKIGWPPHLVYLLILERWKMSYQDLMDTPQEIVQDMMLVMEAEHRVEDDKPTSSRKK